MLQWGCKECGADLCLVVGAQLFSAKERTSAEAQAMSEALSHVEDALNPPARWMSGVGGVATLVLRTALLCTSLQPPLVHPSATLTILANQTALN